ncbi:BadF/BadG/BcrA/BcrD ATPase family protein [Natronobeatus ordinarius]|uniref:BadF/BadG/BcrA/BcrD ATPase family protein n=1 Tax=Natronobeatus ordinarius TaxID=2963433 RepID=UPI0020CC1C60|nr:BadF/BadG/BcrA/BcrD ATPase family protein [Natronobeatus ordinarius]
MTDPSTAEPTRETDNVVMAGDDGPRPHDHATARTQGDVDDDLESVTNGDTVVGLDVGTDYTKAVVVRDRQLVSTAERQTGFDLQAAASDTISDAFAALDEEGAEDAALDVPVASLDAVGTPAIDHVVEPNDAVAAAVDQLDLDVRYVLLMGAKNVTAYRLAADGTVDRTVENGKCAAGVGRFIDDLPKYLDRDLDTLIEDARTVEGGADEVNAQCSVFAESEVISLVHDGVPPAKIVRTIVDSIARRNAALLRRVKAEDRVLVIGGVGRNAAFIDALSREIEPTVLTPAHPAYVPAFGATLVAYEVSADE